MTYVEFTKVYLEFARTRVVPECLHAIDYRAVPEFVRRRVRL